jgi:putative flavoprotein involved in K+ transport
MTPHSHTESVRSWLESFGAALEDGDIDAALLLFGESCFWRDMLAFTWNITTAEGAHEIRAMLRATLPGTAPASWRVDGKETEKSGAVSAFISFETGVGRGQGHLRLVGGKCFTLLTTLYELKGFEEEVGAARPMNQNFAPEQEIGPEPKLQKRAAQVDKEHTELGRSKHPFVVIVGGAHSGVMLAARLRALDVPTIVVEKGGLGDSWRNRYSSLHLHSPKRMDAFPYVPYPDSWPDYPSKVGVLAALSCRADWRLA